MASRLDLQTKLETLLDSSNVYYQPPENYKMKYPAIKYSKTNIRSRFASNTSYSQLNCYEIIVIDYAPDNKVIDKILALPYASYNRHYNADNLNHDVITLYF